jgi:hypothetical protein
VNIFLISQILFNNLSILKLLLSVQDIYVDFLRIIKQTNPDKDLINWSKENGAGMGMNWPVFEVF